jgi:hypothetical protein
MYNTHAIVDAEGVLIAAYRKMHLFDVDYDGLCVCVRASATPCVCVCVCVSATPLSLSCVCVCVCQPLLPPCACLPLAHVGSRAQGALAHDPFARVHAVLFSMCRLLCGG